MMADDERRGDPVWSPEKKCEIRNKTAINIVGTGVTGSSVFQVSQARPFGKIL